nr:MATE family efflux transporter [uncultured Butyrivibrio sp.]
MIKPGIEKDGNKSVLIGVFNSGYVIALLLFLAGSIGSLCDGVIASRGLGVAELAAIGIVYPYTKTMECISLLFSSGSQVIVGRKIGQNKFEEVSKIFYTSLTFIAVLAVLLAAFVCACSDPISRLFGANAGGGTLQPTMEYLFSLAIGAPAHLLTLYMIPLFQLDEKKKLIDITTVIMTVVNVSLNILFVVENMGINGIGYSTSISYYVALMILCTHFLEKKNGILLRGKFSIDLRYLIETVKEGAPSAFKNISSIIFNTFVNNLVARVGTTDAMAAFSVFKMTKFIFLSVSEAIISPVRMIQSMLIEEKDRKMLREIFRYSILKGLTYSVLLSALLCVFSREMFGILVSGSVLDETVYLMRCTVIVYVLNTFVCYYLAYFQAIGKNRIVYSISIVLNIVTLPHFYLLGKIFGARGIWISFSLQFVIVASYVILAALIMGRKNKSIVDKLLVMPAEEDRDYETYDFHIGSTLDAKAASTEFGDICKNGIAEKRKSCSCSLALEEIVFNILDYQQANGENNPNIDVHIVLFGNNKMIMRVKDCSKERDPFAKYEYSKESDSLDNIGIKIVKSFAEDIKYSFIYGVNFITITI